MIALEDMDIEALPPADTGSDHRHTRFREAFKHTQLGKDACRAILDATFDGLASTQGGNCGATLTCDLHCCCADMLVGWCIMATQMKTPSYYFGICQDLGKTKG